MKEEFREFPSGYTDIFIKNMNNSKDHTYNNLKHYMQQGYMQKLRPTNLMILMK